MKAKRGIESIQESLKAAYDQLGLPPNAEGQPPAGPLGRLRRWVETLLVGDDSEERDLARAMDSHPGVGRCNVIAVVSPFAQRDTGKTTTAFVLGSLLASRFRLRVTAVDGTPGAGTLAALAAPELRCERSLADLVSNAAQIATIADLRAFVTRLPAGLDLVTQAPENARRPAAITPALYDGVLALLSIFYEVVLLDVGVDVWDPFTLLALDAADHIVVVMTPGWVDAGTALDGFHPFPAGSTTVVLNKALPETAAEQAALAPGFEEQRLKHSIAIPFDAQLQHELSCGSYVLEELEPASRLAIMRLGLAVARALA